MNSAAPLSGNNLNKNSENSFPKDFKWQNWKIKLDNDEKCNESF
jgi:hypothetical protein